jgi:mRNA interferase RelE/StbE
MKIKFAKRVGKDIRGLNVKTLSRIREKLQWFASQNQPLVFAEKLKDSEVGDFRFRIGDYRVIFSIMADVIYIKKIGHRSSIYK